MESHMELGELTTAAKPCLPRHKCHSCERTRSVKVRVLTWILGKFSLMLIIIVTSAATTFVYHKVLPDQVKHKPESPSQNDADSTQTDTVSSNTQQRLGLEKQLPSRMNEGTSPGQSSPITAARVKLRVSNKDRHLSMTSDGGSQFFTSGHVYLDGNALFVQRATTLFLSAEVILRSMASSTQETAGPSTVVVCLSLERGDNAQQKPIACQLTYLRERDQQVARVWMLFQAEAKDRIYVNSSWPSYVISDNDDNQHSVFTAFEVGRLDI